MKRRTLLALPVAVLAGCGGGGASLIAGIGSGGTGITPGVGSGGTGSPAGGVGAISGFGSIIVNGVRFDTEQARLVLADVDALKLGMTVRVVGTIDDDLVTGTATDIFSAADLRGAASAIDAAGGRLTVLGTDVAVDTATVFAGGASTLADLRNGDLVQVHGLPGTGGQLHATRVERVVGPASEVLTGTVDLLDTATATFRIGSMLVRFAGAVFDPGWPASNLANGQLVRVRGTSGGGVLQASAVEPWYALAAGDGVRLTIAGLVTSMAGLRSLLVDGVPVDAGAAQVSGGPVASLGAGASVEVTGRGVGGVLVAERIRLRRGNAGGPADQTYSAEGPVGAFRSVADFRIRSQHVDASGATFVGGTAADLRNGRRVRATGTRVVDDVLRAQQVEILPGRD